jgi:hypothetical protein
MKMNHVGTRDYLAFAAQWLAYIPLTGDSARLQADADRPVLSKGYAARKI